jgi:uncharacterized protein with HEPN domain
MRSDDAPTPAERLAWLAIQDNAKLAQGFIADMTPEQFAQDRRTFYAVTRCLEIISEAARRLRGPQQERFPHLEWRQIEDAGNVFRHVYEHVAESRVWLTVKTRLPDILAAADAASGAVAPPDATPK